MADPLVFNGLPLSGTTAQRPNSRASNGQPFYNNTTRSLEVFNDSALTYNPASGIVTAEITFTETTGAGTYTGDIDLPAGATIIDIIVSQTALWTATTSAALNVGDFTSAGVAISASGWYTAVDLKATDLLLNETLSFAQSGGKAGAYNAGTNTHWTNRYSATARKVRGVVVTVGAAGTAGRSRLSVVYSLPAAFSATKV